MLPDDAFEPPDLDVVLGKVRVSGDGAPGFLSVRVPDPASLLVKIELDHVEIREAGSENVPEILDGAGACPPESCGGPARYLALLDALRDTANPDHDEAVERFGEDYDPAAYRPPLPVGGRV